MRGYWNQPDATARVLRPERGSAERVLHTGDLFRTDNDGFLYFVTNARISGAYTPQPRRYPAQALLYRELRHEACLLHVFRPNAHRDGPVIRVYELPAGARGLCRPTGTA